MSGGALFVSPAEFAAATGIARGSVYRLMATGELPYAQIGARKLIARTVLDQLLAQANGAEAGPASRPGPMQRGQVVQPPAAPELALLSSRAPRSATSQDNPGEEQ